VAGGGGALPLAGSPPPALCAGARAGGQGPLVDHGAAGGVDEQGAGTHGLEFGFADQVPRMFVQGAMQAEHVHLRQQFREGNAFTFRRCSRAGRDQHLHVKGFLGGVRNGAAEGAVTNDAHGAAGELAHRIIKHGEMRTACPVAAPHAGAVFIEMLIEGKHQGKDVLHYRRRAISGDVGDADAAATCGIDVDIVVAGGGEADQLQGRRRPHDFFADMHLVGQQHFSVGNTLGHLPGRRATKNIKGRQASLEGRGTDITLMADGVEIQKHALQ
jgi:hypothetical protein